MNQKSKVEVPRLKLNQIELDQVIKDSYRTLINIKQPGKESPDIKQENLKTKYAKFTTEELETTLKAVIQPNYSGTT